MQLAKSNLRNSNIILGITGSIAAYKSAELCSRLTDYGANVYPVLTKSACKFIQPLTLKILSKNGAMTDLWYESKKNFPNHIELADMANLILVAPASANTIASFAHGIASDLLSSVHLAATCPIVIAPAMNGKMYEHKATQNNLEILLKRNYHIINPEKGTLACGYEGLGKLASIESILEKVNLLI